MSRHQGAAGSRSAPTLHSSLSWLRSGTATGLSVDELDWEENHWRDELVFRATLTAWAATAVMAAADALGAVFWFRF
jgi:hypothetical protein